jgi:ribonuclease J
MSVEKKNYNKYQPKKNTSPESAYHSGRNRRRSDTASLSQLTGGEKNTVKKSSPLAVFGAPASRKQKTEVTHSAKTESRYRKNSESSRKTATDRQRSQRRTPVKIIPLGGLNEIGKNFTVIECCNDMFIIDCGMAFPDSEMLGVDIVIPDFTYVEQNKDKLRGIVLTHGHEDHIGSLPYFLRKMNVPVYGTRLTLGLVEGKLKEHGLLNSAKLIPTEPRKTIRFGCMAVEFIRVNHSIPDAVGMAVHTPAGVIIHTGDFKVDYTPIEGSVIDLARFAELGNRGVLALMSD